MLVIRLARIEEVGIGGIHPPRIRTVVVELLEVFPVDITGLRTESVIYFHARGIVSHRWPDM